MNFKVSFKVKAFIFLFFAVTIWEHVATENAYQYKPTYFIDELTTCARSVFKQIGELFGMMCSFLEYFKKMLEYIKKILGYIKIEKYFEGIMRIFASMTDLTSSWLWILFGYVDYLAKLAKDTAVLTFIGTLIASIVIAIVFRKFVWNNNKLLCVQRVKKWLLSPGIFIFVLLSFGSSILFFGTYVAKYKNNWF